MPTTVLVIDDDPDIRDVLSTLLHEEGGYTVIEAANPASALDILHTTPHRLIVLFDHHMPRADGAALLALAEQEAHLTKRHAFVCMTSASRDRLSPTLLALLARYMVPLVAKPFDIDDMLAVIGQAELRLVQPPCIQACDAETEAVPKPLTWVPAGSGCAPAALCSLFQPSAHMLACLPTSLALALDGGEVGGTW